MKKSRFITILLLILLLLPQICYGEDILDVKTDIGFDGKIKMGSLNLVNISIKALKQDFTGTLIVNADNHKNKIDLVLTKGAQKEYELFIPILSPDTQIQIEVVSDKNTVFEKNETLSHIISDKDLMLAFLSDKSKELAYLKNLDLFFLKGNSLQLFELNKDSFFHPILLDNFDYIFIDNFSFKSLAEDKQKHISEWVKNGGTMVVGTGPYDYKTLTGILEDLESTKEIGKGVVIKLPWSLEENSKKVELENILNQNVTPKLLNKFLNGENLASINIIAEKLKPMTSKVFATSKSTIILIGILLFAYFCSVIVSILIKKEKKVTYLFILVVSLISYLTVNIGILRTVKAASCGVSIYGKGEQSFSLVNTYSQDKNMTFGLEDLLYFKNADGTNCFIEPYEKMALYTDEGQHFCFNVSEKDTQLDDIKLMLSENIVNGRIVNPLASNLYKAFILIGDTVIPLGDLKGRQRANIEYELEKNLRNLSDYEYMAELAEIVELDKYETTLIKLYLKDLDEGGCKLFGFTEDKKSEIINGKSTNVRDLRLNVFPVNLEHPDKEVIIPPQVIKPVFKKGNSNDDSMFEYILEDDELIVYYPLPHGIKYKDITFYTKVEGNITFEAYNYSKSQWEEISREKFKEKNLQNYIKSGPLTVKLNGNGRIIIPQIEVKGVK